MADSKPSKPIDRWLGLWSIAVGIILYLFPKTPLIVIICLLAIFALLVHPIWSFWWIEKRLWRRVTALIILALALVLIGIAAWPPPETAPVQSLSVQSVVAGWLAPALTSARDLPWRWILLGFAVGALTVLTTPSVRQRLRANLICPDKRLHEIAENDKASIKDLVRVVGILYHPEFEKAYIDFVFSVFNNSLHDIVIDNTLKKHDIRFGEDNEKFYYAPKIESEKPIHCGSRRGAYFVVRQAVRAEDIPRFRDTDNVLLFFHDLEIMFQGAAGFPEIGPTRLNTEHYLETKKRIWRDWDRLEFVFGYTKEQWADIASGKVKKSADSKDSQAAPADTPPAESEAEDTDEGVDEPKPNLIPVSYGKRHIVYDPASQTFKESDSGIPIQVALFRNAHERGKEISEANDIRARIIFEPTEFYEKLNKGVKDAAKSTPGFASVNEGIWLNEKNSLVNFTRGETKTLVIAIQLQDDLGFGGFDAFEHSIVTKGGQEIYRLIKSENLEYKELVKEEAA